MHVINNGPPQDIIMDSSPAPCDLSFDYKWKGIFWGLHNNRLSKVKTIDKEYNFIAKDPNKKLSLCDANL